MYSIFVEIIARNYAERLAQIKAVSKRRREKIQDNLQLREEENQRRRQKCARDEQKRLMKKEKTSIRAKRKMRKYWHDFKRKALVKAKLIEKSSDADQHSSNLTSYQAIIGKRKRRQHLARCYYKIRTLAAQVTNLKKKVKRHQVRLCRVTKSMTNLLRSTLNKQLSRKNKVSSHVNGKLLFGVALAADIGEGLSKVSSRKLHQELRTQLTFKFLMKYRFMSLAKPFFQVKLYKDPRKCIISKKTVYGTVVQNVQMFYEQDDVSTQSSGKKEYIT